MRMLPDGVARYAMLARKSQQVRLGKSVRALRTQRRSRETIAA
jgi:hypothetical protein